MSLVCLYYFPFPRSSTTSLIFTKSSSISLTSPKILVSISHLPNISYFSKMLPSISYLPKMLPSISYLPKILLNISYLPKMLPSNSYLPTSLLCPIIIHSYLRLSPGDDVVLRCSSFTTLYWGRTILSDQLAGNVHWWEVRVRGGAGGRERSWLHHFSLSSSPSGGRGLLLLSIDCPWL